MGPRLWMLRGGVWSGRGRPVGRFGTPVAWGRNGSRWSGGSRSSSWGRWSMSRAHGGVCWREPNRGIGLPKTCLGAWEDKPRREWGSSSEDSTSCLRRSLRRELRERRSCWTIRSFSDGGLGGFSRHWCSRRVRIHSRHGSSKLHFIL